MKTCRKGLHPYEGRRCLECAKAAVAAWYVANSERVKVSSAARRAANPEREKANSAARRAANPGYGAAWRAANLDRTKAANAAYYAANSERLNDASAKWYALNTERAKANNASRYAANAEHEKVAAAAWRAAHPGYAAARYAANPEPAKESVNRRRARKAGNTGNEPVTPAHLNLLFDAQDGCCRYCRAPLGKDKHLDHRIPIARGGPHAPSNVCWACPSCNLRKHTLTESEFCAKISISGDHRRAESWTNI